MKRNDSRRPSMPDMRGMVALLCAAFMLCVLPLLFHDALFDINRFKVSAVRVCVPVLCLLMAAACLMRGGGVQKMRLPRGIVMPCLFLLLFALACVISCALKGFEIAVLDGNEGRYGGLFFVLSCIAAFFLIALWLRESDVLVAAILVCAAACALLGFLNMAGYDPLGFYREIQPDEETKFLSTIGHFDFFGTFLVMMFALAGGQILFAKKNWMRRLSAVCAALIALGAAASRTDSALLGMAFVCTALFALSGDSLRRMACVFALCGVNLFAQPAMLFAAVRSRYYVELIGLPVKLGSGMMGVLPGLFMLVLGGLCLFLHKKGVHAPGRRRTSAIVLIAFALGAALVLGAICYFTLFDTQADLGPAAPYLRFTDEWGTMRGGVYLRTLRAYADFGPIGKLFGGGLELTWRILSPYFDDAIIQKTGIYNDVHCQPLQMLLTCGIFGAAAFVGFYLSMFDLLARRAGDDPVLCGALAMLAGYFVIMLLNVTQPILISTYLSICALAAARLRQG